jgi:hypothetical protein
MLLYGGPCGGGSRLIMAANPGRESCKGWCPVHAIRIQRWTEAVTEEEPA